MYYGLTDCRQISQIASIVCGVLGMGINNNADQFLCEIAAQETHSGTLRDRHAVKMGVGLMQIDRICFDDIMARTHEKTWDLIQEEFGIERNLNYEMLAYSPLLSMIFARLHFRLIPEEFPINLFERAKYWKKYYNTVAGAGTPEEYLENCRVYL